MLRKRSYLDVDETKTAFVSRGEVDIGLVSRDVEAVNNPVFVARGLNAALDIIGARAIAGNKRAARATIASILARARAGWGTAGLGDAALDIIGARAVTGNGEATARVSIDTGAATVGGGASSATQEVVWPGCGHGHKSHYDSEGVHVTVCKESKTEDMEFGV